MGGAVSTNKERNIFTGTNKPDITGIFNFINANSQEAINADRCGKL